jgi:hypothetical protein
MRLSRLGEPIELDLGRPHGLLAGRVARSFERPSRAPDRWPQRCGPGVDDLRIGDEVFAVCEAGQEGAYAEKIAIKGAIVATKPTSLSHVAAAAVALTGLTYGSGVIVRPCSTRAKLC